MGRKLGGCAPLVEGQLHAKFHLDPSNRLATVHQRYRQTDRQTERQTSRLVFTARLRPQFRKPPVRNAPELRSLDATAHPVQSEYAAERRAAVAVPLVALPNISGALCSTPQSLADVHY